MIVSKKIKNLFFFVATQITLLTSANLYAAIDENDFDALEKEASDFLEIKNDFIRKYTFDVQITSSKKSLEKKLKKRLIAILDLERHKKKPPYTVKGLVRRVEGDVKKTKNFFKNIGYLNVVVSYEISSKNHVILRINSGEKFHVDHVKLHFVGQQRYSLTPKHIRSLIDENLDFADQYYTLKNSLEEVFKRKDFPFAYVEKPRGIIDYEHNTITIVYEVHLGPKCFISNICISAKDIDHNYIKNRLLFKTHKKYSKKKIDDTQALLMSSDIFEEVMIRPQKPKNSIDDLSSPYPMTVNVHVKNAPPRLIGCGINYATDEGVGIKGFWTHYNLKKKGHRLSLTAKTSKRLKEIEAEYAIPDVFSPPNTLILNTTYLYESKRAYSGNTVQVGARFKKDHLKGITFFYGAVLEGSHLSREKKKFVNKTVGFPVSLFWNKTNDLLNPTRGFRIEASITPYFFKIADKSSMVMATAKGAVYIPFFQNLWNKDTCSMSFFVKFGKLFVKNIDKVSPNKRLYSGGSGSVRAYNDEMVGPLDKEGVPVGGHSLIEAGTELNFLVKGPWRGSLFFEGGTVQSGDKFAGIFPKISKKDILFGAGFGVGYETSFGPIFCYFAFPLKRRPVKKIDANNKPYFVKIDPFFRFYFGLAKPF